jgi:predicted nuclease with TOPRIM domain
MSEVKKLATEEIDEIKQIKSDYSELAMALGELEIEKSRLLEVRKVLQDREAGLAKQLQDKYGQGSINLETGEITQ